MTLSPVDRMDDLSAKIRSIEYELGEIHAALNHFEIHDQKGGGRLLWHGAGVPVSVDACVLVFTRRRDVLRTELETLNARAERATEDAP